MAETLDMNRGHISDIEQGKREVGIITLPVGDSTALRSLEVWINDGGGFIYGVVGDYEDGRQNVTFAI